MSNQRIAELVQEMVKNPKMASTKGHSMSSAEFTSIQKVFGEYKVSGDAEKLSDMPPGYWY